MAPAIAHFLVGASLLLLGAIAFILRYEIDRAYALWLLPTGGVWGILPDFHHIASIGRDTLFSFHNSMWVDIFALHYTLDRTTIRLPYHQSIFAAIALFTCSIAAVWVTDPVRSRARATRSGHSRVRLAVVATVFAAPAATLFFGVAVSVQALLPTIAALHGYSGVLSGGLLILLYGLASSIVWALGLETALSEASLQNPVQTGKLGCATGGLVWISVVVVCVPIFTTISIPLVYWGAFV